MNQKRDKRTESTDSSTSAMNAMEVEMRMFRRTVADMNKNMEDMRANQEQTAKLLQDQTASMRQQEAAQSVKSPERHMSPRLMLKRGLERGKCPKVKPIQRNHLRDMHRLKDLLMEPVLTCIPKGGLVMRYRAMGENIGRF